MDTDKELLLREFAENGFVIIPGVIPESTLAGLRLLQERITQYADMHLEDPFDRYYLRHRADQGVLYDLCQRHPEFLELAAHPVVLGALEVLLGPNIYMYENSLVYKPKGRRNAVPWHQDFVSRRDEPIKYIAWIALDDVTRENGALQVIPGSHKQGFMEWHRVKGETHHDRIDPEFVEKNRDKVRYVEMKAGDVLIFNMLLLHGSDETHSEKPRRAYRCSYQSMDETVFVPRGAPLVVRGGSPEYLALQFSRKATETERKSLVVRLLNRVGRRLAALGDTSHRRRH